MRRAVFVIPAVLIAVLVAGAAGVYAYDSSREDLIADGISVGGADVGGLRVNEARAVLENDVAEPLQRPVQVRVDDHRYKLTARKAKVHVDVEKLVDEALAASREGNIVSRTWRDLTGGKVDKEIPAESSYSKEAVTALVGTIEDELERDPVNATVEPSSAGIDPVASRDGRSLNTEVLKRDIGHQLELPNGDRKVAARLKTVEPEVTTDDLAGEYPHYLVVDRGSFRLRYYRSLELDKTYTVAVGQAGYDTPQGLYNIQDKQIDPAWHVPEREWAGNLAGTVVPGGAANNPLKSRWMGIYNGAGIHGTDVLSSLGSAASHGCIRMAIPDVEELYDQVPVGTPVYIG
jgi:lipoprotein-anchoring transpeptidase ErfK/SrfK